MKVAAKPLVDKWALFKKLGYTPHSEAQKAAHDSTARYRVPCCGRRWGKSMFGGMEWTYKMFIPETRWWIVGPDYQAGEKEFRVVYNNLVKKLKMGKELQKVAYNVKQGHMEIIMPWDTHLEVRSAKLPESLVGEGLNGVLMSEAAKHTREAWERYIEPTLMDFRGEALFPSTPEGFNWYQGLWQMGQMRELYPHVESWQFPSWTNPILFPLGREDPEIKRVEEATTKQWFDQEYGAQFTSFQGQIYDEFDDSKHVKQITYQPSWRNYLVFDFGFADPFVALDIMVDSSDNVYVWREYQVSNLSTWDHAHVLRGRENPPGYHVDAMFGDPRGADEIATLALVLGIVWARPVGWSQGIEAVKRWLKVKEDGQPKLFIDPSCIHLIRQMKALRVKATKEGHNAKEGQHDYDDHGPDALRYFFSEFFVLGAGTSLTDVYGAEYRGREAESFFTYHGGFHQDKPIGY